MPQLFHRIGLFAKHNNRSIADTFEKLLHFLEKKNHQLIVEQESATLLSSSAASTSKAAITSKVASTSKASNHYQIVKREEIGKQCDLVIVVGGDGSFLNAARAVVADKIPVLGINRGHLGFLADILPDEMEKELETILKGSYTPEKRFLLETTIKRPGEKTITSIALNDIVLYSGSLARMVDFEVYINDRFVLRQQADGLITATPTGSTAYALSAGGPIVYPTLDAITIAPLSPHTLSSRPIVVDNRSQIKLVVTKENTIVPKLSCDGQTHFDIPLGSEVSIYKHEFELTLIHPTHHDYFLVLREKLGWAT